MLFLVLAVMVLVFYLIKRVSAAKGVKGGRDHIRVVSMYHLSAKEKLVLVDVSGEVLLLGVTPAAITTLTHVDKPLEAEPGRKDGASFRFSDFLARTIKTIVLVLVPTVMIMALAAPSVWAVTFPIPSLQLNVEAAQSPEEVMVVLEIIALLTVLALAPAILILMTPFTRLVVVFHFLRQAMGIQTSPPNQVIIGLALFMTFFIIRPVAQEIYEVSLNPYLEREISYSKAFDQAQAPIRKFLLLNTRESDIALFVKGADMKKPETRDDVSLLVLIPAYVISELKTAFIIGFVLYIPFLVIDMVVASVLLAMGMMMLPPIMISLPFKLMLFVLVDGWHLICGSLLKSFGV